MRVYNDKKYDTIKADVRKEFERIEDKEDGLFKWWHRDDQQIFDAWINIINKYKEELLSSDRLVRKERYIMKDGKPVLFTYQNDYWYAAKRYFTEVSDKFIKKYNNVEWWSFLFLNNVHITTSSENEDLIRQVAIDINNAEDEALRKIEEYCNPMMEWDNASYRSSIRKDDQWTPVVTNWEIERQKPMFTQDKMWLITFTDRCNSLSFINMANSSWLFYLTKKKQYPQYTIDYSSCKNQKLKDKMKKMTWWYKWTLRYDVAQKTYFIKWSNWTEIKASSIWIWEWVTFKRKEIEADEAHEEDLKRKEKLWKVDIQVDSEISPENDPELKKYVADIPEKLRVELRKLWSKEYRKFIIVTENRLAAILREYKYYNYELHTNVLSNSSSWLFEINFISRDYEKSVKLWEHWNEELWSSLFSLFTEKYGQVDDYDHPLVRTNWEVCNSFKSEYKKYLEKRIPVKWSEIDELASRENLIWMDFVRKPDLSEWEKLSAEKISSINYWIYLLKTFIQNHRNNEWNSHIDNDDRNLVGMLEDLQNLEATIRRDVNLVPKGVIFSVINDTASKLSDRWYRYTYWIQYKTPLYNDFKSIIMSDDNAVKFKTLRNLWIRSFWADWTTSFLADEISKSDIKQINFLNENGENENIFYAESRLEISDTALNERFQYINACLYTDIEFDWNWELKRTPAMDKIDRLYKYCIDTSWKKIAEELNKMEILPKSWLDDGDVLDKCKEIAETLRNKKKNIENNFTVDIVKKWVSDQKIKLESKYPRTSEEDEELQKLKYYDEHPDEAYAYYTASLECMKSTLMYYWINTEVGCSLAPIFVEEGGWAKWQMWEMYNDIVWYWFWDFSDKTAAILQDVIISIIISVIAWLAISSVASLLGTYLAEHFPGLVKIIEWIKMAISSKISNFVANLWWWIKWWVAKVWVEILKKYNAWLVAVRNTFINNFRAWIPLDGWFSLGRHAVDSVLIMSIAYLSWVAGQFWHLFWEKVGKTFEKIFSEVGEHPERWEKVADFTESITETASKEWLKSIKGMIFSSWDDDIVFESDFDSWLASLDNDIRSWEDKQKLSTLADSKLKFHLSTNIINGDTGSLTGMKKTVTDAVDLISAVSSLLAFRFAKPALSWDFFKKLEMWKIKLYPSTTPWKFFVEESNSWNFIPLSELSSWTLSS